MRCYTYGFSYRVQPGSQRSNEYSGILWLELPEFDGPVQYGLGLDRCRPHVHCAVGSRGEAGYWLEKYSRFSQLISGVEGTGGTTFIFH